MWSLAHPRVNGTKPGCRFSSKTFCIFTLILQSAKVPKYHQSIKIRRRALKYQNIGCIDADFCADFAIFLHFSRSARMICRKRVKLPENARILRTNFLKIAENKHILILWLYSILWYFGGFLYFHFENFENLQPGATTSRFNVLHFASGRRLASRLEPSARKSARSRLYQQLR